MRSERAVMAMTGAVLLGLASAPASARADDDESPRQRVIIATDLTADTLMTASLFTDWDTLGIVGLVAHAIGGPVVHVRYGAWRDAGVSLGLRVGAPAGLGYLGCVAVGHAGAEPDDACIAGGAVGLALGIVAAQLIDWSVLAADEPAAPAARVFSLGGRF